MPTPLKVSDKGAPLTCAEHDANIDRLLDRANHTGTQPASTISNLPTYILNSAPIQNLDSRTDTLETQVSDLQNQLLGSGGYVDNLIDQLESDYQTADQALDTKIQGLQSTVTSLQTADVNLQGLIDGLDNRVDQLETDLQSTDTNLDNLDDSVSTLDGRVSDVENELDTLGNLLGGTNIGDLATDISNIKSVTDPVLNGDKFLVPKPPNSSTGMLIYWDKENMKPEWRLPDGISGGRLIDRPGELRLTLNTQP